MDHAAKVRFNRHPSPVLYTTRFGTVDAGRCRGFEAVSRVTVPSCRGIDPGPLSCLKTSLDRLGHKVTGFGGCVYRSGQKSFA